MADNYHHQNQSQTSGLFTQIIRSLGFGQEEPTDSSARGEQHGPSAADVTSTSAASRVHDGDDAGNDVNTGGAFVAVPDPTATGTDIGALASAENSVEDDEMPPLQDMSDDEEESRHGMPQVIAGIPVLVPLSTSPHTPSTMSNTRTSQRRVRIEDEDEGDRERDRRHPSERAADSTRQALSVNLPQQQQDNTMNTTDNSNNTTINSNPNTSRGAGLYRQSLFSRRFPYPSSSLSSSPSAPPAHRHVMNDEPGAGGGVPWVGLRAARDIPPPPSQTPFSDLLTRLTTTPPPDSNTQANPSATTQQPNQNPHAHEPPTPALVIPVPFGALPTLLRAISSAFNERGADAGNETPQTDASGGNNETGTNTTNTNPPPPPPPPPFTIFGGFGGFPGLDALLSLSEERERDDPARGRQIVTGLEENDEGLVRRLERANKALGEEEGTGCAVCWESLLDSEEASWGEGGEKTPTVPSAPSLGGESSSSSSATATSEGKEEKKKTKIVSLPCAHTFHAECLVPWFSRPRQTTCPVCRFDVDPEGKVWGRRRRHMGGMGGFFGVPPPMPTGEGTGEGTATRGDRVTQILRDMLAFPDGPPPPGPTMEVPATQNGASAGSAAANATQEPTVTTNIPPAPGATTNTNDNDNSAEDAIQRLAERFVMRMLGPAFGMGNGTPTGDGAANEGGPRPRVRVLNNGQGGGPLQIVVDMGLAGDGVGNPSTDNGPAPESNERSTSTPSTDGGAGGNPTASNERERRRRPLFTIGLDMIIGPAPGPDMNPFPPPPGFMSTGVPSVPSNAPNPTERTSTDGRSVHDNPPPQPEVPSGETDPLNVDEDGDVIMEFEHVFRFGGDGESDNETAPTSPSSQDSGSTHSGLSSHEGRHSAGPPLTTSAFRMPLMPSGPPPTHPFLTDGPSYRVVTGTADSMEDAMRQISASIGGMSGRIPIPPMPVSMPTPQRQRSDSRSQPIASNNIFAPWMSRAPPRMEHPQAAQAVSSPPPAPAATDQPTTHPPSQSPVTGIPLPSTPHSRPTSAENNDNAPMSFDQFLRSWNEEEPRTHLPSLASLLHPPEPPRPYRPLPRRASGVPFSSRRTTNPSATRDREQQQQQQQPWTPPPPPGPTLRERVEKKEREAGLRCWDPSCGIGPSDEEPLVDVEPEKRKQVYIKKKADTSDKGKGKARENTSDGAGAICEHSFHPSCLVSATRVANSMWAAEGVPMDGDDVVVSCPVCREEGVIAKEAWEEGAVSA